MKLSKRQLEVVKYLEQDWQMGWSVSMMMSGNVWLQKKVGCGGETIKVNKNTALSLREKGLIKCIGRRFPTHIYILSDKAKDML